MNIGVRRGDSLEHCNKDAERSFWLCSVGKDMCHERDLESVQWIYAVGKVKFGYTVNAERDMKENR